ncbi:competence type IV pilus minor pilin ComGF [Halobacillus litoralis]|uniref:competence type IV pilus minor pilin ComGF n=1 Tax=Halobacillus litoralis TaxID=45668 RepID=UPI0021F68794|nr:competence type IV pilus minor pilin ComGF [Halobacillus litoralis]
MISPECEEGFTLLEVMISLATIMLILSLVTPILSILSFHTEYEQPLAVRQLRNFLQEELNQSRSYTFTKQALTIIDKDKRQVLIEKDGNVIKRTVDGRGYEFLLQNVRNLSFEKEVYTADIKVVMENEERYEEHLHLPGK